MVYIRFKSILINSELGGKREGNGKKSFRMLLFNILCAYKRETDAYKRICNFSESIFLVSFTPKDYFRKYSLR